jgi:hypothetical protein
VTHCEICDLDRDHCAHAFADKEAKRKNAKGSPRLLLVSPSGVAHFEGCPHKGDDPDFSKWARLDGITNALQRLGNDESIQANGGGRPNLVATSCCRDCDNHGPW